MVTIKIIIKKIPRRKFGIVPYFSFLILTFVGAFFSCGKFTVLNVYEITSSYTQYHLFQEIKISPLRRAIFKLAQKQIYIQRQQILTILIIKIVCLKKRCIGHGVHTLRYCIVAWFRMVQNQIHMRCRY
jgi:hypothetical protein